MMIAPDGADVPLRHRDRLRDRADRIRLPVPQPQRRGSLRLRRVDQVRHARRRAAPVAPPDPSRGTPRCRLAQARRRQLEDERHGAASARCSTRCSPPIRRPAATCCSARRRRSSQAAGERRQRSGRRRPGLPRCSRPAPIPATSPRRCWPTPGRPRDCRPFRAAGRPRRDRRPGRAPKAGGRMARRPYGDRLRRARPGGARGRPDARPSSAGSSTPRSRGRHRRPARPSPTSPSGPSAPAARRPPRSPRSTRFMRVTLCRALRGGGGRGVRLLYGGSVKPENAAEIFALAERRRRARRRRLPHRRRLRRDHRRRRLIAARLTPAPRLGAPMP